MRSLVVVALLSGCGSDPAPSGATPDGGVVTDGTSTVDGASSDQHNGQRPKLEWAKPLDGLPAALGLDATGRIYVDDYPPTISTDASNVRAFDAMGNALWSTPAVGPSFGVNGVGETVAAGDGPLPGETLSIDVSRFDASGKPRFAKRYGKESGLDVGPAGIDDAGNAYFTGEFSGPIDFGAGPVATTVSDERFVASLAPDGALRWIVQLEKLGNVPRLAVQPDGGFFLAARADGQDFGSGPLTGECLASFGPDHALRWAIAGTTLGFIATVVADATGGGALVLRTAGADHWLDATFAPLAENNFAVVSFDAAGKTRFARAFATTRTTTTHRLAFSPTGALAVSIVTSGELDLGTGTLSAGGGVHGGQANAYLVALDPKGTPTWSTRYGDTSGCAIAGMAYGADGSLFIGGETDADVDLGGVTITTKAGVSKGFLAKVRPGG